MAYAGAKQGIELLGLYCKNIVFYQYLYMLFVKTYFRAFQINNQQMRVIFPEFPGNIQD